ncbi:unnamed protein product [Mycena citricolor]|uniref:Cation efflux protein transmembrane domain-containing protein n=1 Tax=Mycena citricolor TaxID=2018698 RepID=A0AAD2HHT3_9AGAR|nr:unnamed protein product [Mycena citricolor]
MPTYRRLQQYAIAISIASVLYNGAEGAVSIAFGSETGSRSLVFFGIQSGIEVASALLVLWRFKSVAQPGEENDHCLSERDLKIEKVASGSIGALLLLLALATEISSIVSLALHLTPETSDSSLIISGSALFIMILIWLPKGYLARALNSSVMQGEAKCSLSCIQITIVLFVGSLIFRFWKGGWWVDSATSIVLGLFFGWEGYKMLRWVTNPAFDGGCCAHDRPATIHLEDGKELQEPYRDLCECCLNKSECKEADSCQCSSVDLDQPTDCCQPTAVDDSKCCTHDVIPRVTVQRIAAHLQ